MQVETEGIIFREIKTGGGRTMLLMFSQRFGKISIGTSLTEKRSKSRSTSAIQPFAYGRYQLYQGREIYNLNNAELKKSFYSLSEDLDKYVAASYAMELTEKMLQEDVPEPRVFSLLLDFLNAMEKRKGGYYTLMLAYEVKLLGLMGVFPELNNCAICGEKPNNIFSISAGGAICENCKKKIIENSHVDSGLRLIYEPSFDIVNTLKYFKEKPLSAFENITLGEGNSRELLTILKDYISYHMDIGGLKSESML